MRSVAGRWRCTVLVAALLLGSATSARAAFEDLEVSARARALGGASVASLADDFAPFHNPASLAWLDGVAGAASYVRPFGLDFASQSVAVAGAGLPGRLGGVAIGVRRFGVTWLGEDLTGETTVSLAHGFRLFRDRQSEAAVGWALNVYSLDYGRSVTGIDPGRATGVGWNVGATAVVRDRTRVGFQALHLNNPAIGDLDRQELRRSVTVGLCYAPYAGVETSLDIGHELGREIQYRGGAEFAVGDLGRLRVGLRTEPNAFTAGVGLHYSGVGFDYGFESGGVLGETHQFALRYRFTGPRERAR